MRVGPFDLTGEYSGQHVDTLGRLLDVDLPWWPLHTLRDGQGIEIVFTDTPLGGGYANYRGGRVYIRPTTLRADVLAHEIGHGYDRATLTWDDRVAIHETMHPGGDYDHFVRHPADVPHNPDSPPLVPHGWITMRNPHTSRAGEAFAWWFAWRVGMSSRRFYGPHRWTEDSVAASFDRIVLSAASRVTMFPDVPPESTHHEAINRLAAEGLIAGYADGTFRPNEPVTRGQVAAILARFFERVDR